MGSTRAFSVEPLDIPSHIRELLDRAQGGDPKAQARMGWEYLWGIHVRPSSKKAIFWATQLAEDDVERLSILGHVHTQWMNIDSDINVGYPLLERAADLGDTRAILRLATLDAHVDYLNGKGGPVKAMDRLEKIITTADPLMCFMFSKAYIALSEEIVNSGKYDNSAQKCIQIMIEEGARSGIWDYLRAIVGKKVGDYARYREAMELTANLKADEPAKFLAVMSLSSDGEFYPWHRLQAVEYFLRSMESFFEFPYFIDYVDKILIILPEDLRNAWLMKLTNFYLSEYLVDDRTKREDLIARRDQANDFALVELIEKTRQVIKTWKSKGVIVHPYDLAQEAWSQQVGRRGVVNDGLAQVFAEESLRLSILIGDPKLEKISRSNLGGILKNSTNSNIRNAALAKQHYVALADSGERGHLEALILGYYFNELDLSEDELTVYLDRYKKIVGVEHPVSTLAPRRDFLKLNEDQIELIFDRMYRESPTIQYARAFGLFFESEKLGHRNYKKARYWYERGLQDQVAEFNETYTPGKHSWRYFSIKEYQERLRAKQDNEQWLNRIDRIIEGNVDFSETPEYDSFYEIYPAFRTTRIYDADLSGKIEIRLPKVALVIGNTSYESGTLPSAINDAFDIRKLLMSNGFEVRYRENLRSEDVLSVLEDFSKISVNSELAVFYFAGHGVEVAGQNFLLPVDIRPDGDTASIVERSIDVNLVMRRYIRGDSRLLLLDSCRSIPGGLTPTKSRTRLGFVPINTPRGLVISFASESGGVSIDGGVGERNSPYTEALLEFLSKDEDIGLALRRVRGEVWEKTKGLQEPWTYGSFTREKVSLNQ